MYVCTMSRVHVGLCADYKRERVSTCMLNELSYNCAVYMTMYMYMMVAVLVAAPYPLHTEKMLFLDVIIEDDPGEEEEEEDIVPYALTKEAIVLDMQVQEVKVR